MGIKKWGVISNKAITAAARKLAVLIYNLIKNKTSYQEKGPLYFEKEYRERTERRLKRLAEQLGYDLTPKNHGNQQILNNLT